MRVVKIHQYESTSAAYDASQMDSDIKDGDVLVVASEGVIGFLMGAWPVAVAYAEDDPGCFHTMRDPEQTLFEGRDYSASIEACRRTAEEDADITDNDH